MIEVSAKELYDFLTRKHIRYFYHANTVRTACTLISQKGLLSRREIMARRLPMTTQSSDAIDQQFNVWNDIFLDIVDMHGYFPRQNQYGPVCFKISNDFLLDEKLPNICITKNNPIYWDGKLLDEEKYYLSVEEYAAEFEINMRNKEIQRKMFTIHNTSCHIPFKKYLTEIILDNPSLKINDISLLERAKDALKGSLIESGFNTNILKIRMCNYCFCKTNYFSYSIDKLEKLFKP